MSFIERLNLLCPLLECPLREIPLYSLYNAVMYATNSHEAFHCEGDGRGASTVQSDCYFHFHGTVAAITVDKIHTH